MVQRKPGLGWCGRAHAPAPDHPLTPPYEVAKRREPYAYQTARLCGPVGAPKSPGAYDQVLFAIERRAVWRGVAIAALATWSGIPASAVRLVTSWVEDALARRPSVQRARPIRNWRQMLDNKRTNSILAAIGALAL